MATSPLALPEEEARAAASLGRSEHESLVSPFAHVLEDVGWLSLGAVLTFLIALGVVLPGARIPLIVVAVGAVAAFVFDDDDNAAGTLVSAAAALGGILFIGFRLWQCGARPLVTSALVGGAAGAIVFAGARVFRHVARMRAGGPRVRALFAEVDAYNRAVELLDVHDSLSALGAAAPVSGRARDALATTRRELLRALAIDRVLREHRDVLRHGTAGLAASLLPDTAALVRLDASSRAEALAVSLDAVAEARSVWESELGRVG
jgi:hypothetical protein